MTAVQVGLAASIALYLLGCTLWLHLARAQWRRQPEDLPEQLERLRAEAETSRVRTFLRPPGRHQLIWAAGAAVFFALLWAAEFGVLFQILFVAALGWYWNQADLEDQDAEGRDLRERSGADLRPASRSLIVGRLVSGFMISAGCLGVICFVAGMIVETLG